MIGAVVHITAHASEMLRSRRISTCELHAGLGHDVVDHTGSVVAARARLGATPAVGAPLALGRQHWNDRGPREVLLAVTPAGRPLILVIAARRPCHITVITVWDPTDPATAGWWDADLLLPTERGRREMPPTRWYVAGVDSVAWEPRGPHSRTTAPPARPVTSP